MTQFIKLTMKKDGSTVLVNPSLIESIFRSGDKTIIRGAHTFPEVVETVEQILALIEGGGEK